MSLQKPLISVVTPTFNRKDELVHLFSSMKKQTLDPKFFEMIISDDGSTDGTEEYVKSLEINLNLIYYMYPKKILALDLQEIMG